MAVEHVGQDREFFTSKQQLARYYTEHVLPQAAALATTVKTGAASVLDADPAVM
jgi:hypothetical protein